MKTGNFLQLILLDIVDKGITNLNNFFFKLNTYTDLTWNELLNIQIPHYLK